MVVPSLVEDVMPNAKKRSSLTPASLNSTNFYWGLINKAAL
jgi:hypothetical protein